MSMSDKQNLSKHKKQLLWEKAIWLEKTEIQTQLAQFEKVAASLV